MQITACKQHVRADAAGLAGWGPAAAAPDCMHDTVRTGRTTVMLYCL
jgi:hypothetical protein